MMSATRKPPIAGLLLGGGVLGLGVFIGLGTWMMPEPAMAAAVGPKDFPILVAIGLVVIGGLLLREAFASREKAETLELDWKAIGLVLAALLLQLLVLGLLGWVPATGVLFMMVARAFGSRRPLVDLVIGLVLAGLIFVVFDYGLDLDLPMGSLMENLVDSWV